MSARRKLFVSVSGGRTSLRMAKELLDRGYSTQYEMIFGFANTGEEWEETLIFMDRCDREWGLNCVWLEAVINKGRVGTGYKIVSFQSASRKGEPYEAVIKKYGIPCQPFPHCTRELKNRPIRAYLDSIGWQDCLIAIGIRVDEPARLNFDPKVRELELGHVFPMAYWFPMTKPEVNDWWAEQPFDLGLKGDYQGNCKWCWKKTMSKQIRIAKETPEVYDFPARMEAMYPRIGPEFRKVDGGSRPDRTFFRQRVSARALIQIAKDSTIRPFEDDADSNAGCSESCEVFT